MQLEVDVIEFTREEKIIRPVSPLFEMDVVCGKTPDGSILAAHIEPEKTDGYKAVSRGEYRAFEAENGFQSRPYFMYYAVERYTDLKLKLVVAPYSLIRAVMILSEQKKVDIPADQKEGLDLAIRFDYTSDEDRSWTYKLWTLGNKPLTPEEKRVVKAQYIPLDKVAYLSTPQDLKTLYKETQPFVPTWGPDDQAAIPVLVDFMTGDYDPKK